MNVHGRTEPQSVRERHMESFKHTRVLYLCGQFGDLLIHISQPHEKNFVDVGGKYFCVGVPSKYDLLGAAKSCKCRVEFEMSF